jgi:phosphoribosylaminoimidazole (AIR) synthetase
MRELYKVFNMGIGMVVVVAKENAEKMRNFNASGEISLYEIGVVTDNASVRLNGVDF